jgi:hypothetical protein
MQMLDYANEKGIPVWTAEKLLDFMQMKDEAKFENIRWTGNNLSFDLQSSLTHPSKLAFMIPANFNSKKIREIKTDGKNTTYTIKSVKGIDYAFVSIEGGKNSNFVVSY